MNALGTLREILHARKEGELRQRIQNAYSARRNDRRPLRGFAGRYGNTGLWIHRRHFIQRNKILEAQHAVLKEEFDVPLRMWSGLVGLVDRLRTG
jgi:hypothetical protein